VHVDLLHLGGNCYAIADVAAVAAVLLLMLLLVPLLLTSLPPMMSCLAATHVLPLLPLSHG